MSSPSDKQRVRPHFTLGPYLPAGLGPLRGAVTKLLDRGLGLTGLNAVYHAIPPDLDPHTSHAARWTVSASKCGSTTARSTTFPPAVHASWSPTILTVAWTAWRW